MREPVRREGQVWFGDCGAANRAAKIHRGAVTRRESGPNRGRSSSTDGVHCAEGEG
jgi:hypothetical protein